jgi:hypothetical protein
MKLAVVATLVAFTLTLIGAAAFDSRNINDYLAYANHISRIHALGDNQDASGWRECNETETSPEAVGVVCEGIRSINIHTRQRVDVNYFCEFRFKHVDPVTYQVDYQLCQ